MQHEVGSQLPSCSSRKTFLPSCPAPIRAFLNSRKTLVGRTVHVLGAGNNGINGRSSDEDEDAYPIEIPTKYELMQRLDRQKPLVRVRLSVHYRVHSRQILCIGGSHIPLGWSFLSIAKVPMTWNSGDIWTREVELQAGQRIEHKYVILEEQDWSHMEEADSYTEDWGLVPVDITYRAGTEPGKPPDVKIIQKAMAIVAWQPGPNRIVQVPTEDELLQLRPGQKIERTAPRPKSYAADGNLPDPFEGTREWLTSDADGRPVLEREDTWGWVPTLGARPADNLKGFNFDGDG